MERLFGRGKSNFCASVTSPECPTLLASPFTVIWPERKWKRSVRWVYIKFQSVPHPDGILKLEFKRICIHIFCGFTALNVSNET